MGTPDSQLDPLLFYSTRALEYFVWWEISYLIAAGLIKTSIGVAVIRIALERRYLYTIYVLLFLSVAACVGGVIWEIAACRPISTRWNIFAGTCVVPGLVQISYAITAVTVITDAGYALVPIFILRRLTMTPRIKYALMFVLALGSVAALAAVCRYPFIGYFGAEHNYLCKSPSEISLNMVGRKSVNADNAPQTTTFGSRSCRKSSWLLVWSVAHCQA